MIDNKNAKSACTVHTYYRVLYLGIIAIVQLQTPNLSILTIAITTS